MKSITHLFISLFIIITLHYSAYAKQIPLGLTNQHDIYIQETWLDQKPKLCIANQNKQVKTLQMYQYNDDVKQPIKQWLLESQQSRCVDISQLDNKLTYQFKLASGQHLGFQKFSKSIGKNNLSTASVVNIKALNNSCNSQNIRFEQNELWLKSVGNNFITLFIDNSDDEFLLEFPINTKLKLPNLPIKSVSSPNLVIEQRGNNYLITKKTSRDKQSLDPFQLQLHIDVPKVSAPAMYLISGRKRILKDGWQCFIRGVVVKP